MLIESAVSQAQVVLYNVLAVIVAYLLGSINFGIIISKAAARIDIRKTGSGNAGATNVLRTLGWGPALLTFAGDMLKSSAAVLFARFICGGNAEFLAAAACLLGHAYPVFFRFRGGKGVAASLGISLLLDWRIALIALGVFLVMALSTQIVSLGTLCGIIFLPILAPVFRPGDWRLFSVFLFICLFIIWLHRANIIRLLRGEEKKLHVKTRRKGQNPNAAE